MKAFLRRLRAGVDEFLWPEQVWCLICMEKTDGGHLCAECAAELESLRIWKQTGGVASAYHHRGAARQLVLMLKFGPVKSAGELLADAMAQEARAMQLPEDTVVTWVPMPRMRRWYRGIDHGRVLAEAVAKRLELPARPLLERRKWQREQHRLGRLERMHNLDNAFTAAEDVSFPVLLVDDVRTTGSTLGACCDALAMAGAVQFHAVTATHSTPRSENKGKNNGM